VTSLSRRFGFVAATAPSVLTGKRQGGTVRIGFFAIQGGPLQFRGLCNSGAKGL
jgi:hypothetical protein